LAVVAEQLAARTCVAGHEEEGRSRIELVERDDAVGRRTVKR
jgi:hypothetical protein